MGEDEVERLDLTGAIAWRKEKLAGRAFDLARRLARLAEEMQKDGPRFTKNGPNFNSLGEVREQGVEIDGLCRELGVLYGLQEDLAEGNPIV